MVSFCRHVVCLGQYSHLSHHYEPMGISNELQWTNLLWNNDHNYDHQYQIRRRDQHPYECMCWWIHAKQDEQKVIWCPDCPISNWEIVGIVTGQNEISMGNRGHEQGGTSKIHLRMAKMRRVISCICFVNAPSWSMPQGFHRSKSPPMSKYIPQFWTSDWNAGKDEKKWIHMPTKYAMHIIQWNVPVVDLPADLTIPHCWWAIQAWPRYCCSCCWQMGQSLYHPILNGLAERYGWGSLSILNWLAKNCKRSTYSIWKGPAELVKNQLLTDWPAHYIQWITPL